MEGISGADTHAAPAFYTIGICSGLANLKLHGADFFTFFAVNAFIFFKFQLVLIPSNKALGGPHGAERTPGSGAQESSEENCN
ncbi:hypothetical protein DSECCO2_615440 [anaerobic digester metagenome]